MKVQIRKIGEIKQGVVLNRVKPKAEEEAVQYPILTISRLLQDENGEEITNTPVAEVAAGKKSSLKFGKKGMILIGLTSFHKAVVLTKEYEGMVIPSNFLILEFPGGIVDAYYFAWYFNESPSRNSIKDAIIHGEGKVRVLSIQEIRDMNIDVPDLVTQMTIGNLYSLQLQKSCIWKKILRYEMSGLTTRISLQMKKEQASKSREADQLRTLYEEAKQIERKISIYEKELEFS